jgi:hypothetical protein
VTSAGDGDKPDGERRAREEREDREVRDELNEELDERGREHAEFAAEMRTYVDDAIQQMEARLDAKLRPLIQLTEELLLEWRRRGEQ